ncbi:MAG: LysR family transcriptional regulator [Alphaproteobacteria bacterium]|nr:LysR family transcriptional regulator [Alphaproteobacteria bacterium]
MIRSEHLDAFVAFCEHMSFTHAAKSLHLSQPALHAQIKQLSEDLGVTLYQREGRTLTLTAQGRRLLAFARQEQRRHSSVLAELRGEPLEQPLTLAAGEGAFLYLLGPAVRRFRERSPARLTLRTLDRAGCLSALRSGEAQVAVTVLEWEPQDLDTALIAEVPPAVALPADHPLALAKSLDLEDLAHERLVVPPRGSATRTLLEQLLSPQPWTVAVEARGWPLTLRFVAMGLGAAVVNGCVEAPDGVVLRPLQGFPSARYRALKLPGLEGGSLGVLWQALTGG